MKPQAKKTPYKRIALAFSLCAILVWCILGTGASLAWFADTTPEINNIFHRADFDLVVAHRLTDGKWDEVDSTTKLFNEEALYEPGYVQVVYLRVTNNGDIPFNFYTAVIANDCVVGTNEFNQPIMLQEYLKFGVTVSETVEEMKESVADRDAAVTIANEPLQQYFETGTDELKPGESRFLAIVVRMPEEVDNIANYRGDKVPTVELGVTVKAEQIKKD